MHDAPINALLDRRDHYVAVATALQPAQAADAKLQASLLHALTAAGLDTSPAALAGAAVAVDHALRCLAVADRQAQLFGVEGDEVVADIARGCLANNALLLVDLLATHLEPDGFRH